MSFKITSLKKIEVLRRLKNGEKIKYVVSNHYSLWNQTLVERDEDGYMTITKDGLEFLEKL